MLSSVKLTDPGLWGRIRRFDVERRLALFLSVLAVISSIATYVLITGAPPFGSSIRLVLFLLNFDLVILLLLGFVVGRRLLHLLVQRREGIAGSKLHVRLVGLFAVVAVTPAIVVSIFSVFFLSSGLETWFSDRIRTAIDNSVAVAEAYLEEHKANIRADALAMAADLNREGVMMAQQPGQLQALVEGQAALRALSEAIIFDSAGNVAARSGLSFSIDPAALDERILMNASLGEVMVLTSDNDDRVRALVRLDGFMDAYLIVGRFVDAQVLNYMQRTQNVASQYQLMQSQRWEIQLTTALLFAIVALLLLLAAVWLGLSFADRLASPISQLISAADRVRSGDLMARVPEGADDDELALLSRGFNRMTSQLSSQRRELIDANQQMDDRRRFTEAVLAGVSSGVLGLNSKRWIVFPNHAAIQFLERESDELIGMPIQDVLPEVMPLFAKLENSLLNQVEDQIHVSLGSNEYVVLVRLSAQRSGQEKAGYVLTFDDISMLLSAQRQAAWSEVAKRIAHEIKNPLTPIRLSAERVNRRFAKQIDEEGREVFKSAIDTIIRQVDTIGRLISDFSNFARMPTPVMSQQKIAELVKSAIVLQQQAWPKTVLQLDDGGLSDFLMLCDPDKVTQALNNVLINAVQALSEHEVKDPMVEVRLVRHAAELQIDVKDNGPGFPVAERQRLLEPYVTTKSKGTGLGLAIVNKIMEEHNGRVELDTCSTTGAVVRLIFPIRQLASPSEFQQSDERLPQ